MAQQARFAHDHVPHPAFDMERFFGPGPDRGPLLLIAGPCVLEEHATCLRIGTVLRDAAAALGLSFVFKASFDKANRTSLSGARGPGIEEGCRMLEALRQELGVPVLTDIHQPDQAARVARVADILQIPAFLCRQTDLLAAAAATGRPMNIKKGQFLSPAEMRHAVAKAREGGSTKVMVTERGTFFGYHRLVNDFAALPELAALGTPVCFDVTHSTQLPGAAGTASGGRPECAPLLARAAVAAGVDALFLECHPEPSKARSDASTSLRLDGVPALLASCAAIRRAVLEDRARPTIASGA